MLNVLSSSSSSALLSALSSSSSSSSPSSWPVYNGPFKLRSLPDFTHHHKKASDDETSPPDAQSQTQSSSNLSWFTSHTKPTAVAIPKPRQHISSVQPISAPFSIIIPGAQAQTQSSQQYTIPLINSSFIPHQPVDNSAGDDTSAFEEYIASKMAKYASMKNKYAFTPRLYDDDELIITKKELLLLLTDISNAYISSTQPRTTSSINTSPPTAQAVIPAVVVKKARGCECKNEPLCKGRCACVECTERCACYDKEAGVNRCNKRRKVDVDNDVAV